MIENAAIADIERARQAICADIARAVLEMRALTAYVSGREDALRHLDAAEHALTDGGTYGLAHDLSVTRPRRGRPRLLPKPEPLTGPCRHLDTVAAGGDPVGGFTIRLCAACGAAVDAVPLVLARGRAE